MQNIKLLLIISITIFTFSSVKSQYIYKQAFPNLSDFSYPVEISMPDDGTNRMFVVQQKGKIYLFNNNQSVSTKKLFIDLTLKVSQQNVVGLFGLAFHPNYKVNRHFYVHYVSDSAGSPSGKWLKVMRYTASASNQDTALPSSERYLLKAPLPSIYHNGGKVAFGPDGYLYISFGDGYSGGAPAQDRTSLLGKILRINVDSSTGGRNYSIPPSNPYFQNINGYREEIFAYGFRNTWKFSIDFPTNRILGGDVGEQLYEEINLIENGKNYGWNKMEGNHCYPPNTCDTTGRGFTRPIFEFDRTGLYSSVTGGYVYRGSLLPELYEKYIYGDYERGIIWALTYDGINPATSETILDSNYNIISFGVDLENELYVCSYNIVSGVGRIFRIVNSDVAILNLKTIIEGFYNVAGNKLNIRDTSEVYLRSVTTPYSIIDSSDCLIDSISFSGNCFFKNAPTGKYYIVVKHRNSLETWSREGGDSIIEGNTVNYDFTTAYTQAYGSNMVKIGNKYCLYSGDLDFNGIVDGSDFSITDDDAQKYTTGYEVSDINGDGFVDGTDVALVGNNSFKFVTIIRP